MGIKTGAIQEEGVFAWGSTWELHDPNSLDRSKDLPLLIKKIILQNCTITTIYTNGWPNVLIWP